MQLAPWQITRVPPGGLSLLPDRRGCRSTLSPVEPRRCARRWASPGTRTTAPPSPITRSCSPTDARDGWRTSTATPLLVKTFAIVPRAAQAPGEAQIEIYANPSLHLRRDRGAGSRTRRSRPGAALSWRVVWLVRRLPSDVPAHRRQRGAARLHPRRRRDRSRGRARARRVSFAVRFRRELPAGSCVGVSLPRAATFALPPGLHPDEAAFVHAAPAARRASFIGGRVALRAAMAALGAGADEAAGRSSPTPRGAPALPPGFVGSVSHKRELAVAIAARARADAAHDDRASTWRSRDRCAPTSRRACSRPTSARRSPALDRLGARRGGAVSLRGEGGDLQGARSVGAAAGRRSRRSRS